MARKKTTPVAMPPMPIVFDGKITLPGNRTVTPGIVEKMRQYAKAIDVAHKQKMERKFLRTLKRAEKSSTPLPPAGTMNPWQLTIYGNFIAEAKRKTMAADKYNQMDLITENKGRLSEDDGLSSSASTSESVHLVQPPEHPVDKSPPASTHTLVGDQEPDQDPEQERLLSNDSAYNDGKGSFVEWWKRNNAERSEEDSASGSCSAEVDEEGQTQIEKELADLSRRMVLKEWQHKVDALLEESSDEEEDQE